MPGRLHHYALCTLKWRRYSNYTTDWKFILSLESTKSVRSHAKSPKNKHTFAASSHGLFLTYRGEKYTVLCTRYNNIITWFCSSLSTKTLAWGGGIGHTDEISHPLQSYAVSWVSHLAWCWPHPSPCYPWALPLDLIHIWDTWISKKTTFWYQKYSWFDIVGTPCIYITIKH
jgi:hypothetical protein